MTYSQALNEAKKTGVSKATELPLLAATCKVLAIAYPVNAELIYNGAKIKNLSVKELTKIAVEDSVAFGNLQFIE
jgi:hypothetical protein